MQSSPLISIIVPVYNVKDYLADCLESLVAQTYDSIEIIVVDDGSTDGSSILLDEFAQRDARLRVIHQSNQGVAAARRKALSVAHGDAILFVDADDVLSSSCLQELVQVYTKTHAHVVVSPMVRFSACPQAPLVVANVFSAGCLGGGQRVRLFEDFSAVMALCGKLISRTILEGLPLPQSQTGDDILPTTFLICASDPVALAPRACYFYRQRISSQSHAGDGRFEGLLTGFCAAKQLLKQKKVYEDFAPGFEYVCRVVLTSFMEKYGLTTREEALLRKHREDLMLPAGIFGGRPWKFRLRQWIFDRSLRYGFSYVFWMHGLRRLMGRI